MGCNAQRNPTEAAKTLPDNQLLCTSPGANPIEDTMKTLTLQGEQLANDIASPCSTRLITTSEASASSSDLLIFSSQHGAIAVNSLPRISGPAIP